jgi:hypothetical protein
MKLIRQGDVILLSVKQVEGHLLNHLTDTSTVLSKERLAYTIAIALYQDLRNWHILL